MNLFSLSFSYLRRRPLLTLLNVLLLALGLATIVVLLLLGRQVEDRLTRNAQGIDLVVGAKGSPLQLILASIYHMDAPTGNIPVREAQAVMQNRAVRQAIPLSLGDSFRGYRIVGTTHAYPQHYGAEVAAGTLWEAPYEAVLGARVAAETGLTVGDTFAGTHGLSAGGEAHGAHPLRVVGLLAPTGTVLDRLVLTGTETVWALHGDEAAGTHPGDGAGAAAHRPGREYTALLIQYSSPMAQALFPRFINSQTNLQAAVPAFEISRLTNLLGVGIEAIRAFGILLIVAAALGVFVALTTALQERRYDLAMMRTLGASRAMLMGHILLEGVMLSLAGTAVGLLLGHGAAAALGARVRQAQQMDLTGWTWVDAEGALILLAVAVGLVAALIPALQAYRADIARTLARG